MQTAAPGAVAVLVCALLSPAAGEDGPRRDGSTGGKAARAERLERLHAAIEKAFERCDSGPLRRAFSPRVKTYLASRTLAVRQGYYGADQALLILRRGFEGRTTVRFRLKDLDDAAPEDDRRVVEARWLHRRAGAAKSEARLTFTLAEEGGVWYIREIRERK